MSFWDSIKAPLDISTNGQEIDSLFLYITAWNVFFFLLVITGLFWFSYRYSAKRNKKADYTYGNTKKQLLATLAIGAAVFFAIDLNITRMSNDDMLGKFWNFPGDEEDTIKVEVLAQQWMWNFRYAGADGVFNTEDDILTNHELHIPVGKKVEFRVTSKDVIHSFYLPNARLKVDAMPGRISRLWFEPTQTGTFDIACAEMCGTHHYLMQGKMIVHSQEEYLAWLGEAQTVANYANDNENIDNFWGWKWETNK
ncbi:MAG: cytochrome c oxidase subunit II [Halobacteriovoraceae bacterium]|nr:cytochrome c oxidase subunit II [Halobacteriovoraceae bacterium]